MKTVTRSWAKKPISLLLCITLIFLLCSCGQSAPPETEPPVTTAPPMTDPPVTDPPATEPVVTIMSSTEIAAYAKERTVTVHATLTNNSTSEGSGFFIDSQGTIVTCYHVIDGARELSVEVNDGGTYKVEKILDIDPLHDIAILKIALSDTPFFETSSAAVGEDVRAIGSSLGTLKGTVSQGIVSQLDTVGIIDCVQTDAAISSGNSGGPLVNMYGEVIGINAYSYTEGQNLNLAVDIAYVQKMSMNKNWSINDYREWYDVQTDRSYHIYSYVDNDTHPSLVNTYGEITNATCLLSAWDWDFEDCVEGYDKTQSIFIYEYDSAELDSYRSYLKSIGFEYEGAHDSISGMSIYVDSFNSYMARILIPDSNEWVAIEVVHGA